MTDSAMHATKRAVHRARRWRSLVVISAAFPLLGAGCASIPSLRSERPETVDRGRLERPELGSEYDVLVAETAARDGEFDVALAAYERAAQKDPRSAELWFKVSRLAAQNEDLEGAIRAAESGLELDPDNADGRLFLGRLYRLKRDLVGVERVLRDGSGAPFDGEAALLLFQVYLEQGRIDEATTIAERLMVDEPDNLGAYMAAATAYERAGRIEDAERALRSALGQHPNRFVLYARLARMRRAVEDHAGEIAIYQEVLSEYPDHYGTLVSLGEAQIAQKDIDAAIATYTRLADLYPDDLQVMRRLASLEFGTGRYEAAAIRLRAAFEKYPDQAEFAYSLGQVLRALGRDVEAAEYFSAIPSTHVLYVESRMQIAVIHEEAGRFSEALAEVERLRVLRPDRALDFHAAALRARAGDPAGGLALLEDMLAESPDDEEILYQLGVFHGSQKNTDEALRYMQLSLEKNPENAQALNYVGYTWAERGERLDEAERMIERAVSLAPRDGYIVDSLGWVYYMRARPLMAGERRQEGVDLLGRALEQLTLADELTGGDPVVTEHLGDVYLLLDQQQRALEYYEEAIVQNPRDDEQPELRDKLDRLRGRLGVDSSPERKAGER